MTETEKEFTNHTVDRITDKAFTIEDKIENETSIDHNTWRQLEEEFKQLHSLLRQLKDELYFIQTSK